MGTRIYIKCAAFFDSSLTSLVASAARRYIMADKFGIRVRCASCGFDGILVSEEDKEVPLLFDDTESAFHHVLNRSSWQN